MIAVTTAWSTRSSTTHLHHRGRRLMPPLRVMHKTSNIMRLQQVYGRGSDIWPPGDDAIIDLADSFPGGIVPMLDTAADAVAPVAHGTSNDGLRSHADQPGPIRSLLLRAVRRSRTRWQEQTSQQAQWPVPPRVRCTLAVASVLSLLRWTTPTDILVLTAVSGYVSVLHAVSQRMRVLAGTRTAIPRLPSLPPHGHVPHAVATVDDGQAPWKRLGLILGVVLPAVLTLAEVAGGSTTTTTTTSAVTTLVPNAPVAARPLVWALAHGATTSALASTRLPTSLPLRALVHGLYHTARLVVLWQTTVRTVAVTTTAGKGIGTPFLVPLWCLALAYQLVHVTAVLIPVTLPRYARTHVTCVEASVHTVHPGMEDTVGLSPS